MTTTSEALGGAAGSLETTELNAQAYSKQTKRHFGCQPLWLSRVATNQECDKRRQRKTILKDLAIAGFSLHRKIIFNSKNAVRSPEIFRHFPFAGLHWTGPKITEDKHSESDESVQLPQRYRSRDQRIHR